MQAIPAFYILVVQSLAVLISAIGVIATIFWNIRVTRRRTTVELLLADQTNPTLLEFNRQFAMAAIDGKLESFVAPEMFYSKEAVCLKSTANRYDLIAIAISKGTVDASIYKQYWRATYVRDWTRCRKTIELWRKMRDDPKLFCDFEHLAKKWARPEEKARWLTES